MSEPRVVAVDPDGTGHDALYVVVPYPAGVRDAQQYGGTACLQAEVGERAHLRVDESRIQLPDEAFVPVVTPDGPGVLIWDNSD